MSTRGYARTTLPWILIPWLAVTHLSQVNASESRYTYFSGGETFVYKVMKTGENYTFEFDKSPGSSEEKLKAALHVFQMVYDDGSIESRHSSFFPKEGAKCFVFEANFYTYNSCFLPNDFSVGNEKRFWGFVSRVPNGMWLLTRNLIPALLILGFFFFIILRKPRSVEKYTIAQSQRQSSSSPLP